MNSPYASIALIAVLVLLMYFVVLRPQRRRQQQQADTMRTLEPGTRVMMTSGIYATIVAVGERQIVLETSPGVELTVLKQAVAKVVPPGEEDDDIAGLEDEAGYPGLDGADATNGAIGYDREVRSAGSTAVDTPDPSVAPQVETDDASGHTWPPTPRDTSVDPGEPAGGDKNASTRTD